MENAEKTKKPLYKKWWFWLLIFIVIIIIANVSGSDNSIKTSNSSEKYQKDTGIEVTVADFNTMTKDEAKIWLDNNKMNGSVTEEYSDTVASGKLVSQSVTANTVAHQGDNIKIIYSLGKEPSIEEKNALVKAQSYSDNMHISKKKIYDQLTSSYGEGFSAEAAQYAVNNVKADYNYNALEKAKSYRDSLHMSKNKIYDQLTSSYGEGFTASEAQYAIDNLEE